MTRIYRSAMIPPTPAPAFLGVMMLDTRFPRPLGDVGHPDTFGVPSARWVVKDAIPKDVVQSAATLQRERLIAPFQHAVAQLVKQGAASITTSCGFLVLFQEDLQSVAGQIPVVTSSLLHLPDLLADHKEVGVLTIDSDALGVEHLLAAGVPAERLNDTFVQGVARSSHFATQILGNQNDLDLSQAQIDVVSAAMALKARAPQLTDMVLECTNMPPYAAAIQAATGCRTWSLLQSKALLRPFDGALAP